MKRPAFSTVVGLAAMLCACAAPDQRAATGPDDALEEIVVLRSIREAHATVDGWCAPERTGFTAFPVDAERHYGFWSMALRPEDGRVVDAQRMRVAELRACFGATSEPVRQNFYAEVRLGALVAHGKGECLAIRTDFPEPGLFSVHCHLVLGDMAAPYVGGLLTTNTITSRSVFGADTSPRGYTQASVATIRLWKARPVAGMSAWR